MSALQVVFKSFGGRTFRSGTAVTFDLQIFVATTNIWLLVSLLAPITCPDKHNDISNYFTDYAYTRLQVCEKKTTCLQRLISYAFALPPQLCSRVSSGKECSAVLMVSSQSNQ